MKAEYDFSNAARGKFYRPDSEFIFPVYLAPDVERFLSEIAQRKQIDVQDLVNEWLRNSINLVKGTQS